MSGRASGTYTDCHHIVNNYKDKCRTISCIMVVFYYKYSGTSAPELNSFWKTFQEVNCSKTDSPLSPERCMTDHTGVGMKGLSDRELRSEVLFNS